MFESGCPMQDQCKVFQHVCLIEEFTFFQDVSKMMQDFDRDLTSLPTLSYRAKDLKSLEVARQHLFLTLCNNSHFT